MVGFGLDQNEPAFGERCVVAPEGERLALVVDGGLVEVGDAAGDQPGGPAVAAAWSLVGTRLASAGHYDMMRLWAGPSGFDELLSFVDRVPGLGEVTEGERLPASLPHPPSQLG